MVKELSKAIAGPNGKSGLLAVVIGLLLVSPGRSAEGPLVLPVLPAAVPSDHGTIGPERVRAPSEAPTKDAKWITNVTKRRVGIGWRKRKVVGYVLSKIAQTSWCCFS